MTQYCVFIQIMEIKMIRLELPLPYYKANSKALLTLNVYRNLHHHFLNKFKIEYGNKLKDIIKDLDPITVPVRLEYELHFIGKKRVDLINIGCMIDKVFSDCLVELGVIQDDSIQFVQKVTFIGSLNNEEMKCFVSIKEIK